jgi:Kef-type K+ transport system membrane component KefB
VVYIVFMLAVARPGVHRLLGSPEKLKLAAGLPQPRAAAPARLALLLGGFVLSTLVTQWIGIHAIFGAFLFGAIVPHDHPLAETLVRRLKSPVTFLLLPAFFAFAGMRTRIDLLTGGSDWLICGLIIVVASVGKIGGCFAAARASGMQFRDAAAIAFLMNTRGLMELIVLNIGLDLGVISPVLFTMMVVMALVTTMGTTPIVDLLMARKPALQSPDIR